MRLRVLLYLPGDHFKRRCFKTKLVRFTAGKGEKEGGTELSCELLHCVAGVCFVKRDVITVVCQTLLRPQLQKEVSVLRALLFLAQEACN